MMDFGTTRAWERVNLADGGYQYEKVWVGGHSVSDNAMILFKDDDGDILLEIVLTNTRRPKFFTYAVYQLPILTKLILWD